MKATYKKYILNFKRPSGTSRGVLTSKETWFIKITKGENIGIGECGILRGLSADDVPNYEKKIKWVCEHIHLGEATLWEKLKKFPSIQLGVETAFKSLESKTNFELFPSDFTRGNTSIPINGLIWMGEKEFMKTQIEAKLKQGFSCIKLKIGAINFEKELALLKNIRSRFSSEEIELRVDANGAFSPKEAPEKLKKLSEFELHSIEQPIAQGQIDEMANLCKTTPLPIALDEELIGIFNFEEKENLLQKIQPQYIILKPSLIGGFKGSKEWISLAQENGIGWWITSALESNIGLNAISQFTFLQNNPLPQGLGTGSLFTNNFESPLKVENGKIKYQPGKNWKFNF